MWNADEIEKLLFMPTTGWTETHMSPTENLFAWPPAVW